MNNVLEYKSYFTKVEYSVEDKVLHGKIEGIKDLVTFECDKASEAEAKFREAVDDYLAFCEDIGQEPEKPFKGVFNIRLTPKLHKKAAIEAAREGITLNQFVVRSVESQLDRSESVAYTVRDENGFTSEELK